MSFVTNTFRHYFRDTTKQALAAAKIHKNHRQIQKFKKNISQSYITKCRRVAPCNSIRNKLFEFIPTAPITEPQLPETSR